MSCQLTDLMEHHFHIPFGRRWSFLHSFFVASYSSSSSFIERNPQVDVDFVSIVTAERLSCVSFNRSSLFGIYGECC